MARLRGVEGRPSWQSFVIRIATAREGYPRSAHFVGKRLPFRAVTGHGLRHIHIVEDEWNLESVERPKLAPLDRRFPGEVILIHCRLLRGFALRFEDHSRAKRRVGSKRQIQIRVGDARPALPIGGDHLVHLRIAGVAKRLLHVRVQAGIVNRVEHLIREECDFGFGGADQQRNIRGHRRRRGIERVGRKRLAVRHRCESQSGRAGQSTSEYSCEQLIRRKRLQLIGLVGLEPELRQVGFCRLIGNIHRHTLYIRAALDDRAMKKPLGRRHSHQHADLSASAGLAENRDVAGIAAESRGVVANPFEGGNDIELADVARVRELLSADSREIQVAKNGEAVVDRDHDDVMFSRELLAGIAEETAGAGRVSAAVQPDHDRALSSGSRAGRPHVQHEAILAHRLGRAHYFKCFRDLAEEV